MGIFELWRINWREKRHGCFKEACVFNRVPVLWVLMFPPAWGLWNGAYLCTWYNLLHELTLKCFPGSFWGFLAWLSVTMHAGVGINAIYAMFPFSLSLSPSPPSPLPQPEPTSLYPAHRSFIGDYGDFSIDSCVNHLPSVHRCIS